MGCIYSKTKHTCDNDYNILSTQQNQNIIEHVSLYTEHNKRRSGEFRKSFENNIE